MLLRAAGRRWYHMPDYARLHEQSLAAVLQFDADARRGVVYRLVGAQLTSKV